MIKANELRLGNLVLARPISHEKLPFEPTIVKSINLRNCDAKHVINGFYWDQGTLVGYEDKDLQGIPITEEWLIKLGGRYYNGNNYYLWLCDYIRWNIISGIEISVTGPGYCGCDTWDEFPKIKYIHQVQNLVFALKGEELSLNW